MSKKKEKEEKADGNPIDYILEIKNLEYTITLKSQEIDEMKDKFGKRGELVASLQEELHKMKEEAKKQFGTEEDLRRALFQITELKAEIEKLKLEMIQLEERKEKEKAELKKEFDIKIKSKQDIIDGMTQKIEWATKIQFENEHLKNEVLNLKKEITIINKKHQEDLERKEVRFQLKYEKLRKKMLENISNTQERVSELNMQYMDVSTKLTLLQNHQLLIQLEYQTQQIDELTEKKQILEKKVFSMIKDIEIHKEVELSLAEKNKKLKEELMKYKDEEKDKENEDKKGGNEEKGNKEEEEENKDKENNKRKNKEKEEKKVKEGENEESESGISPNNNDDNMNKFFDINGDKKGNLIPPLFNSPFYNGPSPPTGKFFLGENFPKVTPANMNNNSMGTKIINLEKKLNQQKKDYNLLKERYEHIETVLRTYETKYSNLLNFLEESLNNFFNDTELQLNREVYVNIDSIQKCDFSALNKEEKYSVLVLLMKYIMPLVKKEQRPFSNNSIEGIKLNYHFPKRKMLNPAQRYRQLAQHKANFHHMSCDNIENIKKGGILLDNLKSESLPSVRGKNRRPLGSAHRISSSSYVNSTSTNHS